MGPAFNDTGNKEIGEFGAGRPDFGGRRPRGDALGQKKRKKTFLAAGARPGIRGLLEEMREFMLGRSDGAAPATPEAQQEGRSGASPIDLKTQKLTSVLASFWPGLHFRVVEKES